MDRAPLAPAFQNLIVGKKFAATYHEHEKIYVSVILKGFLETLSFSFRNQKFAYIAEIRSQSRIILV